MPTYQANDVSFCLPDGLEEKTQHGFELTDESGNSFHLSVWRTPLLADETFAQYCLRLHNDLSRKLPKFELYFERVVRVAERPCWAIDYRWCDEGRWQHQRQMNLYYTSDRDKPMVAQITGSVPGVFTERWSKTFLEIVHSISVR